MVTRDLIGLLAMITLGGAAAAGIGMQRSRELTGDWIGYGIPNEVAAMIGIGLLSFASGMLFLLAATIAVIGDRLGIWKVLETPILDGTHPVARIGRGILRAQSIWDTFVFLFILGVVIYVALHDRLVAMILAATALVIAVLYWILRDRARMGGTL